MSLNVIPINEELYRRFKDNFDCGNDRLNQFFNGPEVLDEGIGKTYVFLSDDGSELLGYYNITTGMIGESENPMIRMGGSIHINCFALDNRYHGLLQGEDKNGNSIKLSDIFFTQCMKTIFDLRKKVGFSFITLSSTEEGYSLYQRADFEELDSDMFIVNGKPRVPINLCTRVR